MLLEIMALKVLAGSAGVYWGINQMLKKELVYTFKCDSTTEPQTITHVYHNGVPFPYDIEYSDIAKVLFKKYPNATECTMKHKLPGELFPYKEHYHRPKL